MLLDCFNSSKSIFFNQRKPCLRITGISLNQTVFLKILLLYFWKNSQHVKDESDLWSLFYRIFSELWLSMRFRLTVFEIAFQYKKKQWKVVLAQRKLFVVEVISCSIHSGRSCVFVSFCCSLTLILPVFFVFFQLQKKNSKRLA